jgi:hypothetical protein
MTQRKLDDEERNGILNAADAIAEMCDWDNLPEGRNYWDSIHTNLSDKAKHGTTDGKPWVEPELTDEDAKQRPWVMVRDDEAHGWHGPRILAARCSSNYYSFTPSKSAIVGFRYCRLATPEEIEAANADR